MIRAIVFDFDGLIVDTETSEYESYADMYRRHGADLPLSVWSQVIGTDMASVFDPYAYLEQAIGRPVDREPFRAERRRLFDERMAAVQPLPGVVELIAQARRLGLAVGIASSSTSDWIEGYLDRFGIRDQFDCVRSRDHVAKVKPDPELYRQAAAHLGVRPEEAIAFEDSANGALAAHRAGLHCVIVPNPVTAHMAFGPYSRRLPSLAGLDLAQLAGEIGQAERRNTGNPLASE